MQQQGLGSLFGLGQAQQTQLQQEENEDSNIKMITPKEGSVIFFTGCQSHSVSANTSDETRITMAINFNGQYSSEFKPIDNPSPFEKL